MNLPRRPLAVVFDLDGTLIDSEALVRDAYFAACADFGVAMSEGQFLTLVGMHKDANDIALRAFYGADFPVERFRETARGFIGERGAPYALATSSHRPWVERHFLAHDLGRRFRATITRDDVVNGKPDPEPYLKASAALGANPSLVLALEDSHAGVRSAHAAGCMTIMIPDLLAADDEMRGKALVLRSLLDVAALLNSAPGADGK